MTQEQRIASDPKHSVWVSASAGTGKTKVLTDRVLRLLLAGARPGSILCVTFTKAAAAEMLERIEQVLGKWAVAEDAELTKALVILTQGEVSAELKTSARRLFAELLDTAHPLKVQTLHGFCQSIIARFPLEAGVATHTTLLDEHDAAEMLQSARMQLFADAYNHSTGQLATTLRDLARAISEGTLREVLGMITMKRQAFSRWLDMPGGLEQFSVALYKALGIKPGLTEAEIAKAHFTYTDAYRAQLTGVTQNLVTIKGALNAKLAAHWDVWLQGGMDANAYADFFFTDKGEVRKKLCTNEATEQLPALADMLQQEISRAESYMAAHKTLHVARSTTHLMTLAHALLGHYREEKKRRGVIDYDDLISLTVKLLCRSDAASWVLFKLDNAIDHLLVDEAQDTSPEQWRIVEALVNEFYSGESARRTHRTLFVVGDDKQSIFSFQGAQPRMFDQMRSHLMKRARAAEKPFENVRLYTSFRSTEAVLSAVDTVFATEAARKGLVFSEQDITHAAHRTGHAGRVELWPLVEGEKKEKRTLWEALEAEYHPSPEQKMAQQLTAEIKGWLTSGRMLAAKGRPVRPGDIMILVQRRGIFADAMIRALKRAHIPVAGADRLVITEHIAVKDCMALADFLLLPQDDYALARLLKSPFVGLTEEELLAVAAPRGGLSLWQALRAENKQAETVAFLLEMLARADYMAPYELFSYALVTLGKRKAFALRLGREADDPLDEFLTLAMQYERQHPPSLQGFMHWIASSPMQIKRDMEKGRDEVRLMTVHASKGLQAPIIFLPDTTRVPPPADNLQWMEGAPPLPLWSELAAFDDKHIKRLKGESRAEILEEYRRLLYVAMTRAEDELYITGWKSASKAPSAECWYELVRNAVDAQPLWSEHEGKRILSLHEQQLLTHAAKAAPEIAAAIVPDWAQALAPEEPTPTRPLSPSRLAEVAVRSAPRGDDSARLRGVMIHRLLQILPDHPVENMQLLMEQMLDRQEGVFTPTQRSNIMRQVTQVLEHPDYAKVFSSDSLAEVPVVGVVTNAAGESVTIAGQMDRLVITEDKIIIVDFKTGLEIPRSLAEVPFAYKQQMDAYRRLMQKLYPHKTIQCALLWTEAPLWMAV